MWSCSQPMASPQSKRVLGMLASRPIRHRFATGRRNRWVPILRLPWTTRLCQSQNRRPPRSRARRSGSGCSSSTWSGARRTSGSPSRSTRSRRSSWPRPASSRRRRSCWPGRSRAKAARSSRPSRREWRDSAIVGALLLGGGNGLVAFGEQTVPSGIAALLIATDAGLGRDPRSGSSSVIGCRAWRSIGIVVGFAGVAILVGPSAFGGTGVARSARASPPASSRPIAWAAGSLFASHRAVLPGRPLVATGLQMVLGGLVLAVMAPSSGELGHLRPGGGHPRFAPRVRLPDR